MILTTGARFWLAATAFLGLLTTVSVFTAGGHDFSTIALGAVGAGTLVVGLAVAMLRDGDVAAPDDPESPVAADPRVTLLPAGWPAVAAVGLGVLMIGWAAGGGLLLVGLAILAVVLAEWMVQGWAERATGDPDANQALRNRVMFPFEIPIIAVLVVGGVVLAFSRVLLALPKTGSTVIAIVVAAAILGVAFVLAYRPHISSSVVTGVAVVGAVALLGGGIGGAVAGEREFHKVGHEIETEFVIPADDISFLVDRFEIPAGEEVTIVFDNRDTDVPHNLHIQGIDGGAVATPVEVGPAVSRITVDVERQGEYRYICDVHPVEMQGTLVVTDDIEVEPHTDTDAPPGAEPGEHDADPIDEVTDDAGGDEGPIRGEGPAGGEPLSEPDDEEAG